MKNHFFIIILIIPHTPIYFIYSSQILLFFYIQHTSCSKIDDLEDIAADLFDFGEEKPKAIRKEKTVKKQKKNKNVETVRHLN